MAAAQDIERESARSASRPNSSRNKPAEEYVEDAIVTLTEEDDKRIRRKTDKVILAILTWVYFLQVLDKAVLGTGAVYDLQEDAGLDGNQFSLIGTMAPIAQLAWQPFSAFLIVKVPHRILMPSLILGWGIAETCMAACDDFAGLLACRFFLGLFEAGCMPLFTIITGLWYRRVEQPNRIALWYSMNGTATIAASAISYGLGHIESDVLHPWQIIFLFCGLLTVITAPFVYWKLDNDVTTARFLTDQEKLQAVERLRANQDSVEGPNEFKWTQVWEAFLDPKTWLWVILGMLPNLGSTLPSIFGPLIVKGFGFDEYETLLLNMPFGAVQAIVILLGCWAAHNLRIKSAILFVFMLPVVAGTAMLYKLDRNESSQPALLAAYYIIAFLFSANPLLLSWMVGNTAGATKKSVTVSFYQAGLSAGNLIGPLLFSDDQAPEYREGILGVLGVFIAMVACVVFQTALLFFFNKLQEKKRVRNGKPAKIVDRSMQVGVSTDEKTGEVVDEIPPDLTDRQNDEFVYIY